jgi:hypothetical protein
VFKEYEVPLDADAGLPPNFVQNDGSDWSLGTPSVMIPGWGVHDAWLDFQGDLWFTCNIPNKQITIGRIATKTGAVKLFAVPGPQGLMAQTHGMTRDANGIIWFNVNPGRGGIGRMDPKTEQLWMCSFRHRHVADRRRHHRRLRRQGQDLVVVAGRRAALRSGHRPVHRIQVDHLQDAERHRRHLWRGRRPRRQRLVGRDGARHHRQGQHVATGKAEEVRLAPVQAELDRVTPRARKFFETYNQPDFNSPLPWAQGPRRMGTDKADDVLWVGNSWGRTSRASTPRPTRQPTCRCRTGSSPTTCMSTRSIGPGPTCGAPTG